MACAAMASQMSRKLQPGPGKRSGSEVKNQHTECCTASPVPCNSPEDEEGCGGGVEADYPIHDAAKEDTLAETQRHIANEAGQVVRQAVIALAGTFPVDDAALRVTQERESG